MEENTKLILCPDCGAEILQPEGMAVGDILECSECGTEIEILSLDPLKFSELVEEK